MGALAHGSGLAFSLTSANCLKLVSDVCVCSFCAVAGWECSDDQGKRPCTHMQTNYVHHPPFRDNWRLLTSVNIGVNTIPPSNHSYTHTHLTCTHTHTTYALTHTHTPHMHSHTHTPHMHSHTHLTCTHTHTHTSHALTHTHTHLTCTHTHTHTHMHSLILISPCTLTCAPHSYPNT